MKALAGKVINLQVLEASSLRLAGTLEAGLITLQVVVKRESTTTVITRRRMILKITITGNKVCLNPRDT